MKCSLVCYGCKKSFEYSIEESVCKNCGKLIVDSQIKLLVFTLNNYGIETERSCEGHSGFDYQDYYDFPWIVITNEKDLKKLEAVIDEYNNTYYPTTGILSQWKIIFDINARKYRLFPKEIYKDTKSLQKESKVLAEFICNR